MMVALKLPTGTHSRNYAPGRTHVAKRGPIKPYSAILLCVLLIQVPLLLSFMGGTLSAAHARRGLPQRITGFTGAEAQEIQSALHNLKKKKNVRFWIYRNDQSYPVDQYGRSKIYAAGSTMIKKTTKFGKQDNLLMFSTYGLKTNGKCEENTCPITIQGYWVEGNTYGIRGALDRNLRYLIYSGKSEQAVVGFLDDLANSSTKSSDEIPGWKIWMGVVFFFVLATVVGIIWLKIKQRIQGRTLVVDQVNGPEKLDEYSNTTLGSYSRRLLDSVAKKIDTYGLAVQQAEDDLGAANIPQFRQSYDQTKDALTKAYHIRQLIDDHAYRMKSKKRAMLIELITTLQTANINLAQTADNIKAMREEFVKSRELSQKLVQKSIDLEGRIPTSATILDILKKLYSTDMLSTVLNNIEASHEELYIAKQALDLGQTNLKKGTPAALDYIHTADSALQKITKLLDDIDLFEVNVHAIINQLPQQIQSAQNLIKDAETSLNSAKVTNSTTVNQVKVAENQLQTAIDYAQKNINVHPFEAQQKLQEKFDDLYNIVPQFRSETTKLTNKMAKLRSLCASARTNISSAEHRATQVTPKKYETTNLAEAKRKLELAQASLQLTNITVPELNEAINTAEEADNLSEQVADSLAPSR